MLRKSTAKKEIEHSVGVLARAAISDGHVTIELPGQTKVLSEGKILMAVAVGGSVTLKLGDVKHPSETLASRLVELESALMEIAHEDDLPAGTRQAALTAAEEAVLNRGGFDLAAISPKVIAPVDRATAEFARLVRDSHSTEEAARILDVNTSRIRQRVVGRPRTLFGFKLGTEWRIPKFQFEKRRVVSGIGQVVAKLPSDLHPVAVYRWFATPNPDLTCDDAETPVSPLDWLKMGNPPAVVADLASAL